MSFPVAFQSAVFYVLSCAPCAKVRHRKKARERAKREREEKARLESNQPELYQHPSPFNTNPYWREEINMGPSLPKKSASKNSSQRGLTSSGGDSSALSISEHTNTAVESHLNIAPSTTVMSDDDALSDDWNRRKGYQREDEELWGQWSGQKLMEAISKARDSAGRLIESTLGIDKEVSDQDRREFYFAPKNQPINEYHPPVVSSKAPCKDAHRWMLQPPPPAKFMEGKVPVSRAGSSGSKSSGRTLVAEDVQLGRLVQEKLVMEKLKRESSNPTETELIESLFAARTNRSLSIHRTRSLSFDTSDDSMDNFVDRRRSRLRPVAAPPGAQSSDDDDSDSDSERRVPFSQTAMSLGPRLSVTHAAQRPNLETIMSTRSLESKAKTSQRSKRKSLRAKRLSGAASPVGDDTD
ncbi:hypothetical protein B0T10DRAFT_111134 [Thelonectria olida]|uniref:Signal peptide-containing protein n=1 Tax=Thelonectria olida TaxID=1576542 RepID=A0A9P8WE18_9HYPO|nr:hypothetical protein B0T10DRAFT_111134 [Thelonectria olida]